MVISGNLVLQSLVATSLAKRPPLLKAQLDRSLHLRAPPLHSEGHNASLFVGVLSATNHFAERTAVRRTWMQHPQIRSGEVVVRFFLALVRGGRGREEGGREGGRGEGGGKEACS